MTITVAAKNSTQLVLTYSSVTPSACRVEVSESVSYSPLVHDVNSTLFTNAHLDSRSGSLGSGSKKRTFIAGTRPLARAVDGNVHSRAVQHHTKHHGRLTRVAVDTSDSSSY